MRTSDSWYSAKSSAIGAVCAHVAAYREALLREHYRGGQSFFVVPRIADLPKMEEWVAAEVPEVKAVTAHGQMSATAVEERMSAFYDRKYDVLLSTTIVESGLDIPSANTIVIHRADRFGLAQLYQLRGRVGRERQQADDRQRPAIGEHLAPVVEFLEEHDREPEDQLLHGGQVAADELERPAEGGQQHGVIGLGRHDPVLVVAGARVEELPGRPGGVLVHQASTSAISAEETRRPV